MNTKCSTCGAPQQLNDTKTCIYCGDVLKSDELNENLLKDFIPIKYEYSQGNYNKVIKLADKYLENDLYNIPCWAYKIVSEFFYKSEKDEVFDFKTLMIALKSLMDLDITSKLSLKVVENQLLSIFEIIEFEIEKFEFINYKNFNSLHEFLNKNFSPEFTNIFVEKYKYSSKRRSIEDEDRDSIFYAGDRDPLFEDVAKLIVDSKIGSTSLMQRRMKLGYNRAGRLMDQLEAAGIVGPSQGNKPREVYCKSMTELNEYLNSNLPTKFIPTLKLDDNQKNINNDEKKGCFIATATMGDYDHPIVLDLRMFRDNWLLNRKWGIEFINWYYLHSPKAAKVIEKDDFLKKISFYLLIKPLHFIVKKVIKYSNN